MPSFNELKSVQKLRELGKKPIDLSKDGELSIKRMEEMQAFALGLKLFYATERLDREVLKTLFELAKETNAVEKMHAMQSGEIVNFVEGVESEKRAAMHTAMRDFFDHRNESEAAIEATKLAYAECEKLKLFLEEIEREKNFTDLVQIGIGGSELGPKAVYLSLRAFRKPGRNVHFISNVDPDDASSLLSKLNLSKTLVVIVSKSGMTLETKTNEEFARRKFLQAGLAPADHFIAVTGKGSPMDDPSHYRASFYIWDYIGGRYSVTSMVGAVALAFALGMDKYLDFLRGASSMDKVALEIDPHANLPLLAALIGIWNRNFLGHHTCAIIPYSQAMSRFSAHLQQLEMESNGKQIDKYGNMVNFDTGPIIWGEPGTNGQHSFYQLIHQGTTIVPIEFIGFKESQYHDDIDIDGTTCQEKLLSNLFAQSIGLATGKKSDNPNKIFFGNRPNHILLAKRCDPYTIGTILSYYEHKVAFKGFIWNINSFDQEGVQLGKVLANRIIDMFAKKRREEDIEAKTFPQAAYLIEQLEEF
jgi:glucose-6-phosphate isomerase